MRMTALKLAALLALACAASPALAQGSLTLRDRLSMVSSASSGAVTQMLVASFADRFEGVQRPQLQITGSGRAMDLFCAGVGPETPDLALTSRRMPRAVADTCRNNGVTDIIELRLGLGAVIVAARRGDPAPALTSRHIYEALAAERTDGEGFAPNRSTSWHEIDSQLPRREIRMIVPERSSGTRALMEDLILEAGCREVKAIRLLFEAAYRRGKCVTLRDDGRVVAVRSDDLVSALLAAPPGTLAIMSFDQLLRSGGNLLPLNLDGVLPTSASIASLEYEQTRTIYLYAKRQHSRNRQGVGVVRGITEMLNEATSEQAFGPGGYLTIAGLVPLTPAERAAQRRIAERMTLMSR